MVPENLQTDRQDGAEARGRRIGGQNQVVLLEVWLPAPHALRPNCTQADRRLANQSLSNRESNPWNTRMCVVPVQEGEEQQSIPLLPATAVQ